MRHNTQVLLARGVLGLVVGLPFLCWMLYGIWATVSEQPGNGPVEGFGFGLFLLLVAFVLSLGIAFCCTVAAQPLLPRDKGPKRF